MRSVLLVLPIFFSFVEGGMCSSVEVDQNDLYQKDWTPAYRSIQDCIRALRDGMSDDYVISLFNNSFPDDDDPDCYTELCKLAKLCGSSDEQIRDEFWAFYGLTAAGHKYFRKLSDNIPHSTLIYNLKQSFLSDTK